MTLIVKSIISVVLSFCLVVSPLPIGNNVQKAEAVPVAAVAAGGLALMTLLGIYGVNISAQSSETLYNQFGDFLGEVTGEDLTLELGYAGLSEWNDAVKRDLKDALGKWGTDGTIPLTSLMTTGVATGLIPYLVKPFMEFVSANSEPETVPGLASFALAKSTVAQPLNVMYTDAEYPMNLVSENHDYTTYFQYKNSLNYAVFLGTDGYWYTTRPGGSSNYLTVMESGLWVLGQVGSSGEYIQLQRINVNPTEPDTPFTTPVNLTYAQANSLVTAETIFYISSKATIRLGLMLDPAVGGLTSTNEIYNGNYWYLFSGGSVSSHTLSPTIPNVDVNLGLEWWTDTPIDPDSPSLYVPFGPDCLFDIEGNMVNAGTCDVIPSDLAAALRSHGMTLDEVKVGLAARADGKVTADSDVYVGDTAGEVVSSTAGEATKPNSGNSTAKARNWNNMKLLIEQIFPFCLAFDLAQLVSLFGSDPVSPVVKIPFALPGGDSTDLVLDFSVFDPVANVFRIMTSVLFVCGLIFLTLKFIRPDQGE